MSDPDLGAIAELATRAATEAGALLAGYLPQRGELASTARSKSSLTDLVSSADLESERTILEMLLRERPDDGVLAEEGSRREGTSGVTWVIDPLDGTTNYLYGLSSFAVSIAAATSESTLVGVVHDPTRDETFVAIRGGGTTVNGRGVAPADPPELGLSLVGTGFGYSIEQRRQQAALLPTLLPSVRDIRRSGSAALDLCAVATGRLDAFYEAGLAPWDRAAGHLIAIEAGCSSADLVGLVPDLPTLVVARQPLLDAVVDLLRRAARPAVEGP